MGTFFSGFFLCVDGGGGMEMVMAKERVFYREFGF